MLGILKNKWLYIGAGAVLVILAVLFVLVYVVNWGISDSRLEHIYKEETFINGIYINDINVSGLTMDQGRELAVKEATDMLKSSSVRVKIGETVYTLKGSEIGALVDYESVLRRAILVGRNGSRLSNSKVVKDTLENGRRFYLSIDVDKSVLESTLKEMSNTFNTLPQESKVVVDIVRTPSNNYLSSEVKISDSVVGRTVDIDNLMNSIIKATKNGEQNRIILTSGEETLPENVNLDKLMEELNVVTSTTISLEGLESAQIYNIWKASDLVNNTVLEPGESFSFLEKMGEMDNDSSWKFGKTISNTGLIQEMGGGMEYVASALYLDALQASFSVEQVEHHLYVPANMINGLDARISKTEGIDLKFTNTRNFPVRILVNCDGGKKKELEIVVYGGDPLYTFEISTHVVSEMPPVKEPEVVVDETKEPGYEEWVETTRNEVVVEIYRQRRDGDTGESQGNQLLVEKVRYPAVTGKKVVGKVTEPEPTEEQGDTDKPAEGENGTDTGQDTENGDTGNTDNKDGQNTGENEQNTDQKTGDNQGEKPDDNKG